MTGGACAGFSVTTGAPISGIMFAIAEAHQRITPMIVMVSATSVMVSRAVSELLAPLFGVSISLFPRLTLPALSIGDIWIPLVVGIAVGLFSVLFLKYYAVLRSFWEKALGRLSERYKIFAVFTLTLALGLCSVSFISSGHELVLSLFNGGVAVYMLLIILVVRSTLTLSASANGITGGMFVPPPCYRRRARFRLRTDHDAVFRTRR